MQKCLRLRKKLANMLSFAEKLRFEKTNKVMTYYGCTTLGRRFFCYVLCGLDGYQRMQADFTNRVATPPEQYGKILYKDYLEEPDEKAKAFLAQWLADNNGSPL